MKNLLFKTKISSFLGFIISFGTVFAYTLWISNAIRESTNSISTYFFMMLGWFFLIFVVGAIFSVFLGEIIFGTNWKNEYILEKKIENQKVFKDYRVYYRVLLVVSIGSFIIIFNKISEDVFDFYNKVGLHLSQLNYKSDSKKIEAIKTLYLRIDDSYIEITKERIKDVVKKTDNKDLKAWGVWYFRDKGDRADLPFIIEMLSDKNDEVVGEAALALYLTMLKQYKTEDEKILNNLMNPKFEYADIITRECERVGFPQNCIQAIAYFDGAKIYTIIQNRIDKKELYPVFVWLLGNSSSEIATPLLKHIYENGSLEDKCLTTIAFGKTKSLEGEKILLADFEKYRDTQCPTIKIENRAADPYIIGKPEKMGLKILDALDKIESLEFSTRKFLYDLSQNKSISYDIRNKASVIYEKHEFKYKSRKK
ncbi:hypothetical protein JXR93_10865 [bacterium]|nr:hypothetical protein [bacterium]